MFQRSLAAALLLAVVAVAPADPAGWRDEVLVAPGPAVSHHTGLAISTHGSIIHVAWATSVNADPECNVPWYTRSTDGGQTWEPPRPFCCSLGTAFNQNQVAMVADDGTVAALAPAGQPLILRDFSPDNGITWEGGRSFGQGLRPAVTSLWGWRFAVWDDKRFGGTGNTELFFKRSMDQGRTWGPPPGQGVPPDNGMRLTDLPGRSEDADICSEVLVEGTQPPPQPCGFIIVVWADNTPGDPHPFDLRINWSGDGGESWFYGTQGHEVWPTPGHSRYPAIDCYETAYPWMLHLVWQEGENGICYTRSTNRGESWDALQQIGTGYHPDVVVDQHGVHVVWWTHGMYTDVIKYRRSADFGNTWGPVIQLTSLEPSYIYSDSRFPKITADPQGRHVVFGDSREASEALAVWYKQNPISSSPDGQSSVGTTPAGPALLTVRPNPTNGPIAISFSSALGKQTSIAVHDACGREVRRLTCSGSEARWNGQDLQGRQVAAGVYYLEAIGPASRARTQVLILR